MGIHDREHLEIEQISELYEWLEENSSNSPGLWVVTHKKNSGKPAPSYDDIVRAVLCFGWIDSVPGKVDEQRTKLYLSPRKKGSAWSNSNKVRIEELLTEDSLRPAGLAAVEEAKRSGTWNKIDSAHNQEVPEDLSAEFVKYPGSKENFDAFPPSTKRAILEWIIQAKAAETRFKRINETASLAAENIRANQWNGPKNPK
jgi:uncharacterized protein YdeI (YjbR/CyaY-like superfamily)